jgi:thioester reductase-like protein
MRIGATPAKLVAVVRATDEQAALAKVIEHHRIPPHVQKRLIVLRAA